MCAFSEGRRDIVLVPCETDRSIGCPCSRSDAVAEDGTGAVAIELFRDPPPIGCAAAEGYLRTIGTANSASSLLHPRVACNSLRTRTSSSVVSTLDDPIFTPEALRLRTSSSVVIAARPAPNRFICRTTASARALRFRGESLYPLRTCIRMAEGERSGRGGRAIEAAEAEGCTAERDDERDRWAGGGEQCRVNVSCCGRSPPCGIGSRICTAPRPRCSRSCGSILTNDPGPGVMRDDAEPPTIPSALTMLAGRRRR